MLAVKASWESNKHAEANCPLLVIPSLKNNKGHDKCSFLNLSHYLFIVKFSLFENSQTTE